MAVKLFNTRVKLKNDSKANWTGSNLVLLPGEIAIDNTNYNFKIGNGTKTFDNLAYVIGGAKLAGWTSDTSSNTAISESDTLETALHKLENRVNSAVAGGVTDVKVDTTSVVSSNEATLITMNANYNASTNKLATASDITNAINALDATIQGTAGAGNTVTVTQTDGVVTASYQPISITASQVSDLSTWAGSNAVTTVGGSHGDITLGSHLSMSGQQIVTDATGSGTLATSGDITTAIGNLDTTSDISLWTGAAYAGASNEATYAYTIKTVAEENGIVKAGTTDDAVLYLSRAQTAANPILTKADIGSLSGAMHFKGVVNSDSDLPSSGQVSGDVYTVATDGTYAGEVCEVGDMIIWNGSSWVIVSGENQVIVPGGTGATITVGNSNATTILTTDGVEVPLKVNVTAGSSTVITASNNDGSRFIYSTVEQGTNTGTITTGTASVEIKKVAFTGDYTDLTNTPTIGSANLTILGGTTNAATFSANSTSGVTVTVQGASGIEVTGAAGTITVAHDNSVTAVTTASALKVAYDAQGHITSSAALTAADVSYDPTNGVTGATTVQAAIDSLSTGIKGLDATVDADVTTGDSPVNQSVPTADFEVLNSVTETDGKLTAGTAYTVKKVAATANPADLIQPSGDMIIFDCGSASANTGTETDAIAPNATTTTA